MSNAPAVSPDASNSVSVSKNDILNRIKTDNKWFASAVNAIALHINQNADAYNDDPAASDVKMTYAMLSQKREVSDARKESVIKFIAAQKHIDILWDILAAKYGNKQSV